MSLSASDLLAEAVAACLQDGEDVQDVLTTVGGALKDLSAQFTVVAVYSSPVQIFCTSVDALDATEAVAVAWEECCDGNSWDMEDTAMTDEWDDVIVLKGAPENVTPPDLLPAVPE